AGTQGEIDRIKRILSDAKGYLSRQSELPDKHETGPATSAPNRLDPASSFDRPFISRGPHLFIVGLIKDVHCDPPSLDLLLASPTKTMLFHTENYYKIQFTALFALTGDLNPCKDLENRLAKVEYLQSIKEADPPRLVAVELHK